MTFLESLHRKLQVIACYMYVFAMLDFICEINLLDNLVNNRWKAMALCLDFRLSTNQQLNV